MPKVFGMFAPMVALYADKGYGLNPVKDTLKRKGCHDATIKKNNMREKNRDKDRWLSAIRALYEHVLAHRNKKFVIAGKSPVCCLS